MEYKTCQTYWLTLSVDQIDGATILVSGIHNKMNIHMIKSWNIPKNTPFASKECGLQSHIVHSKTVHAHHTCTVQCTVHTPYSTILYGTCMVHFGVYVIFSNLFENAILPTNCLNIPFFPVLFLKLLVTIQELVQFVLCCMYGTP